MSVPQGHLLSIATKTAIVLFLSIIVFWVVFNVYLYPRHGLAGFDEKSYREAMLKAGHLFAVSENMQLKDMLYINCCSQEDGNKHFAWGTLRLSDKNGCDYILWVSIHFGNQKGWYRDSIGLLVDPRDKLLFVGQRPRNIFKTTSEIVRIWREGKRQLRECFFIKP